MPCFRAGVTAEKPSPSGPIFGSSRPTVLGAAAPDRSRQLPSQGLFERGSLADGRL